jgi:hypothetical protein
MKTGASCATSGNRPQGLHGKHLGFPDFFFFGMRSHAKHGNEGKKVLIIYPGFL